MNDMSSVIVPKSDQINADDLIGGDMTITINDVKISGGQEQPVSIYFDGSNKAFRPCKSMSRVLVAVWGADAKQYVGRSIQLYRDPTVKWGGMEVGGIRIRAMSHIENAMTMALTATKGSRKPFTVRPLAAEVKTIASAFTIEDARQSIADAGTLDDLRTAWSRKPMAPFREQLQAELDARKAALGAGETGASEHEDRGEALSGSALSAQLIDEVKGVQSLRELGIWEKEMEPRYLTLDDDLRLEVDGEIATHRVTLA